MTDYTIRTLKQTDRQQWDTLYQGYAAFYAVDQTQEMRDTVWEWLQDDNKEVSGLVAENTKGKFLGGKLLGLAHFRPFARPLSATTGAFLDDLFVMPEARGQGVADALINHIKAIAVEKGWSVVRWITADNNYRGRAVYDRLATKTNWVTYDIKIE